MNLTKQKGQSTTEYILIIGLVVLVAIAALKLFGVNITSGFKKAATTASESK